MIFSCAKSGSTGNGYFIRDDNEHYLMLDCGAKLKWINVISACDFNISLVDGLLVTHWHNDHLPDVKKIHRQGIPVYGSNELKEYVKETQGEIIQGLPEKRKTTISGGWKVVPWYVPHTGNGGENVPCFAYYIESPSGYRIVYITDFLYSPLTFKTLKPNTILVACNHDDDIDGSDNSEKFRHVISGHSSLSTVNELIKVNQTDALKNVILCHLSASNATPVLMFRTIQSTVGDRVYVFIAHAGMQIDLRHSLPIRV